MPLRASLYFPVRNFFEGVYEEKTLTPVSVAPGSELLTRPHP